jgi:hypothetical protein
MYLPFEWRGIKTSIDRTDTFITKMTSFDLAPTTSATPIRQHWLVLSRAAAGEVPVHLSSLQSVYLSSRL